MRNAHRGSVMPRLLKLPLRSPQRPLQSSQPDWKSHLPSSPKINPSVQSLFPYLNKCLQRPMHPRNSVRAAHHTLIELQTESQDVTNNAQSRPRTQLGMLSWTALTALSTIGKSCQLDQRMKLENGDSCRISCS
jgi:hypothetical protein